MTFLILILLLLSDAVCVTLAYGISYYLRYESGLFEKLLPVELIQPMIWLVLFWWVLFFLRNMYRIPVSLSRFEELVEVFKAAAIGVVIIFIATFDTTEPVRVTRIFLINYGVMVFIFVGSGRVIIRTFQRRLRWKGIGLKNALIVGFNSVGFTLHDQVHFFPVWGFRVRGFVDDDRPEGEHLGVKILGTVNDLPKLIRELRIGWVMVAPESQAREALLRVFDSCVTFRIRFMLVADYYQMVVGLVRTVDIHGLPLVEVAPDLVPNITRVVKRLIDMVVGLSMLAILTLLTPLLALLIRLDSPGPVFYVQRRVGKGGKIFRLYKFRSMVRDAEKKSGAIWASRNDPRVTRVGKILRQTHLDELPQFFNVLKGDMSLVGPRPERPRFVEEFHDKIPLYDRRLRIRPGITGWAQVRHKYDESLDDVKEKTRYDLFYIDHISLQLDLKILFATAIRMLRGLGHS